MNYNQNFEPIDENKEDQDFGKDFEPIGEDIQDTDFGADFEPIDESKINEPKQKPATSKGFFEEGLRHLLRSDARILEAIGGAPGQFVQFAKGLGEYLPKTPKIFEQEPNLIQKYGKKALESLPTPEDLKEVTTGLTGEYLEPQGPGEQFADNIVQDATLLAMPVKGKIPFVRAIGTATGINLGAEVAKGLGVGEKGQAYTKMVLLFISGLMGRETVHDYESKLWSKSDSLIPKDAMIKNKALYNETNEFIQNLKKGGIDDAKRPALSLANQLQKKMSKTGGFIPVDELPEFRKTLNRARFSKDYNPKTAAYTHRKINEFDDILMESLKRYGAEENPQYLKAYDEARSVSRTLRKSSIIADFISKKIDPNKFHPATVSLFGKGLTHIAFGAASKGAGVIGASSGLLGTAIGYKILARMATNPTLRKHYLNTVKHALKENGPAMIKNFKKLDEDVKDLDFEEIKE